MFLKVVPFSWNIRRHFHAIGQTYATDLAQRRIWLLGRHGSHLGAHAPLLGRAFAAAQSARVPPERIIGVPQRRSLGLLPALLATLADQLIDRRHAYPFMPSRVAPARRSLGWQVITETDASFSS